MGTRRALLQSCELCANKDSIAFPIALHASQNAGNMAPKLWIKRPKAGKLHKWVADREWPHIHPPSAPTSLWAIFGPQAWQSHMSQGFGFSKVGREGGGQAQWTDGADGPSDLRHILLPGPQPNSCEMRRLESVAGLAVSGGGPGPGFWGLLQEEVPMD